MNESRKKITKSNTNKSNNQHFNHVNCVRSVCTGYKLRLSIFLSNLISFRIFFSSLCILVLQQVIKSSISLSEQQLKIVKLAFLSLVFQFFIVVSLVFLIGVFYSFYFSRLIGGKKIFFKVYALHLR